jgi:hypothetical protein
MSFSSFILIRNAQTRRLALCTSRSLATSAQKRAAKRLATAGKPVPPRPGLPHHKSLNTQNIPKAPHMAKDAIKKEGIIDHIKQYPFIPMVVIFPTFMMGLMLIIRPDLRAQWLGLGAIPMNADGYTEKVITNEVQKVVTETEGTESDTTTVENVDEVKRTDQSKSRENEKEEVRDLIYAIGIRPHQSS